MLFVLLLPVNNSDDTRRVHDFFLEEKDSLDVVFLGSSDVYAGYSPVLAYEEYGFTSYPYVLSGNYIGLLPYQIQDSLDTQSPKLFVIEITEAMNPKPGSYDHRLREYIAGIPSLSRRHALIQELGEPDQRLSYYFPFSLYHGNADWKTLWENGQRNVLVRSRGYSLLKGALSYTGDGDERDFSVINTTADHSTSEILSHTRENFTALLELCKAEDYNNILFVTFPHRTPDENIYFRHQHGNAVGELIRSYGYDYINLDAYLDDIGLQPETDFLDDEHLNLYGQYKTTRYLCNILAQDYGIGKTQLSDQNRERWETCVEFQHLYYSLFDSSVKSGEDTLWLKENAWLLNTLEGMKK